MQDNELKFKQAEVDFRKLQKDQQLPPLMELKLALLKALISNAPEIHDIAERLQHFERESIEELPLETQKRLFIDIVGCLSGRESSTYCKDERVYIFREGKLFAWQKFYLTCTTNILLLSSKRETEENCLKFEWQKVNVSKFYKRYEGKQVFALDYQDLHYILGFDDEVTCKRLHKAMGELIEQKQQWLVTKFDNVQYLSQMENARMALPAHKIQQFIDHDEYQYLLGLEEKIKEIDLVGEADYKIHKNIAEGRVLVGNNGTVKSQFLVKGFTAEQIAEKYIQMTAWNPEIELFEITGRPRHNCLVARLRTKKYSLISYQREAMLAINFFKPCHCQDTQPSYQSYLLIEDLPMEEKPQGNAIRMNFRQTLGFLPNRDDPDLLLVVILTEVKFNGFAKDSDTSEMTLHFTEQIDKLLSFVYERRQTPTGYFRQVSCPCGGNDNFECLVTVDLPSQQWQNEKVPDRLSLQSLALDFQFTPKRVISTLQDICGGLLNQQFLELMKHRANQSYYLKHRFSAEDQCFQIHKEENRNFLREGVKWQFKGDELIFIDKEVLAIQKDILKMILKQLSANLLQGKSIMNMSLPVEIFDKRSLLDAIADSYGFVAAFADQIKASQDPIEQMKYMICGFMFINATGPTIQKPFNPILGETYQGKVGNLPITLEQISHHPPISSLLIKTPELQISANIELVIDMGLNSANSYLCHWLRASVFATQTEYLIKLPELTMQGIVYGNRTVRAINKGFIFQSKNNIFAEFSIGKTKKRVYECKSKLTPADVVGGIFRVKQQFAEKVKSRPKPKSFQGLKPEYIVETCSLLRGKWYGDLEFDGKVYKSKEKGPFPFKSQKLKYLLPSDSIWRQDLVYKIWKDNERSNREKERLQNLQRNDRKLREKYCKPK